MNIRKKLISTMLLVALVPFIIAMTIGLIHSTNQVRSLTISTARGQLRTAAEALSGYFFSREDEISTYANLPLIKTMDWEKIGPYLRSEKQRHGTTYEKLFIGRPDAHYYTTEGGNPAYGGLASFDDGDPNARLKSISQRPYWQKTVGNNFTAEQEVYVSNPMISYTTGVKQVVVAASIISDSNEVLGLVAGGLDWDEIESQFNKINRGIFHEIGDKGKLFLVSTEGAYIYHWDPKKVVQMLVDESGDPILNEIGEKVVKVEKVTDEKCEILSEVGKDMVAQNSGTAFFVDPSTGESLTIIYTPIKSANYSIGLVIPEKVIMSPAIHQRSTMLKIMALVTLVVLVISIVLSGRITKPIVALSKAARDISAGREHTLPKQSSGDEIEYLTDAFNSMVISLKQNEESMRTLVDNIPGAVFRSEVKFPWRFEHVSEAVFTVTGYQVKDFIESKVLYGNLILEEDLSIVKDAITKCVNDQGPYSIEYRITDAGGATRFVLERGRSIYDEQGKALWLEGVIIDVTDRMEAEERLKAEQVFTDTIIKSTPGLFYFIEKSTAKLIRWNDNWIKVTGYSDEELGTMTALDVVVDRELCACRMQEVYDRGYSSMENCILTKSGDQIPYYFTGDKLIVNGKTYLVGLGIDISKQKLAEQQREQLVKTLEFKNRALQEIVYTASHDLRSPLVNIQGFGFELESQCKSLLKLIDKHTAGDDKRDKIEHSVKHDIPQSLGFITTSASKMMNLLDGLLQVSRIGTVELKREHLDINKTVRDVLATMEYQLKENDVEVTTNSLPGCTGDANMLDQIFTNLIGNAIKYRDRNRKAKICISGKVENDMSIYCVEDNGIGIEPGHQEKVFEIFHRLNPQDDIAGEGLGLTIVMRILDRLGGKIWLESQAGKGSKFFFSLPTQ